MADKGMCSTQRRFGRPDARAASEVATQPQRRKRPRNDQAPNGRNKGSRAALQDPERLKKEYPDAHCELDFETPLQLLIATILSAQCTDKRVNMVTPELFRDLSRRGITLRR